MCSINTHSLKVKLICISVHKDEYVCIQTASLCHVQTTFTCNTSTTKNFYAVPKCLQCQALTSVDKSRVFMVKSAQNNSNNLPSYSIDSHHCSGVEKVTFTVLHHLLPPPRDTELVTRLRHANKYPIPFTKTKRFGSFINFALANYVE